MFNRSRNEKCPQANIRRNRHLGRVYKSRFFRLGSRRALQFTDFPTISKSLSHQLKINQFQISNTHNSDEEHAEQLVIKALEMTFALKQIAQYYFNEAEVGSPYISTLIEIDYQFNSGCEDMVRILRALKNKLRYNFCFCNTLYC